MLERTDVVILAGGKGTRLAAALPAGHPKALAAVGGRPLVAHVLEYLYRRGARRVVLALGHGAERIEKFLAGASLPPDLTVATVVESRPLGTGGALRHALSAVRSDPFVAMNGDCLSDVDLEALLDFHSRCGARITLALSRVEDAGRYGKVDVDASGRITAFVEKAGIPGGGLVNAGVYVLDRAVVAQLPAGVEVSFEREVVPGHAGRDLYGLESSVRFLDIGTPESLEQAGDFLQNLSRVRS